MSLSASAASALIQTGSSGMVLDSPAFSRRLAAEAAEARVSPEVATAASELYPAARQLSLVLPVPETQGRILLELGNLLHPGYKNLTLHPPSRLASCFSAAGADGRVSGDNLRYSIFPADSGNRLDDNQQVSLVASVCSSDLSEARATHQQLGLLAQALADCIAPHLASLQEAALCFIFGEPGMSCLVPPMPISGNTCTHVPASLKRPEDDSDASSALSAGLADTERPPLTAAPRPASLQPADAPKPALQPCSQRADVPAGSTGPALTEPLPHASSSSGTAGSTAEAQPPEPRSKAKQREAPAEPAADPLWMTFQDAALEGRFRGWYNRQLAIGDWFWVVPFIYGIHAMVHGTWYTLRDDLPLLWRALYGPAIGWGIAVCSPSLYMKHRITIMNYVILHIFINHIFLVAPAILRLPPDEVRRDAWASFLRIYPLSFHLGGLWCQVPFRLFLPRQLLIVLSGIVHLPAALSMCLPHLSTILAVILGIALVLLDTVLPLLVNYALERRLRASFLLSSELQWRAVTAQ